jgi:hypothetical protein
MRSLVLFALLLSTFSFAFDEDNATVATRSRREFVSLGLDLQWVPVQFPNYWWTEEHQTTLASGNGFHMALEWIPFDERYGKLGVGLGTGVSFVKDQIFGSQRATLATIPVEAFASYRFDYLLNQILVPFVKAGVSWSMARQWGITNPGWRSYYGLDWGGGLELCLNVIDRRAAKSLALSSGIDRTYITLEFLRSGYLGQQRAPDLTRDEYRLGFRFEM